MNNWFGQITLDGEKVSLSPLNTTHREALMEAAADGKLWELWFTSVPSEEGVDNYILSALKAWENNKAHPFVVKDKQSGKVIGSTRYCNADPDNRRLEIGFTWYAQSYQRTGVNTECKYLLLKYAFEALDCIAVEFKTNWHNHRSKTAIQRLGAKQDGILRNHRINADGSLRDTVIYSITREEWVNVKKSLEYEMKKYH
ncbi:GNAT family protein [Limibacter armeniacum]|uniref:GNAT family N-acetyltransferase n=1 Tax=Limibacter armeniacum TaxID=466084 RepID=UPI002FE51A5B